MNPPIVVQKKYHKFAHHASDTEKADFFNSLAKCKGVGKGGGGAEAPQILTHVTSLQKNVEKQERKKQLLGYKHADLHTKIEAQKCPNIEICCHYMQQTHWLHCHRQIVSSVLVDMQYCTPVQSNLLCCCT